MCRLNAWATAAALALTTLPGIGLGANLNPPKVSATSGEPVSLRQKPGFEARCFKESTIRERGAWTNPTRTSSDYRTGIEVRDGAEYLGMSFRVEKHELKLLMELTAEGQPRRVPPLIETNIPGFEKEYGAALTQMVTRTMSSSTGGYLGRTLELGRDYGPTLDVCMALGVSSSGTAKGKSVADGTLTYSGRPAFLVSQTFEQACVQNGVRFEVNGTGWAVHDNASGLVLSSAVQFNLFSQGTRFSQVEEFVECGVAEKK